MESSDHLFDWSKPLYAEGILQEHGNMIYKLALSQTKNKTDAEDFFREIFVRLIKYKPIVTNNEHAKARLIRTDGRIKAGLNFSIC